MLQPRDFEISRLETGTILLVMTAAIGSLQVPGLVSRPALHDGWLAVPLAGAFGMLSLGLVASLARRFPNETIVQYAPRVLGNVFGKGISFLFILVSMIWAGLVLREFSDFVLTTSLPRTPIAAIVGIIALAMVHGARQGVEVLGRLAVIFTPIALFIVAVVLGFGTQQAQLPNLEPVMAYGLRPIIGASIESAGFFGTSVLMAVIFAFSSRRGKAASAAVAALGLVIVILTVATAGVNATFNEILTAPVGAILVALSLLCYESRSDMTSFLQYVFPLLALAWQFGIPALLFGAAAIRGEKHVPPDESAESSVQNAPSTHPTYSASP